MAGPRVTPHIYFDVDLTNAFNAPFTEFASFTLKEGQSRDELLTVLKKMRTGIDQVFSLKHAPCALGKCVENPETFYLVAGWDNVAVSDGTVYQSHWCFLTSNCIYSRIMLTCWKGRRRSP